MKKHPWHVHLASLLIAITACYVLLSAWVYLALVLRASKWAFHVVSLAIVAAAVPCAYLLPRRLRDGALPKYPPSVHAASLLAMGLITVLFVWAFPYRLLDGWGKLIRTSALYGFFILLAYLLPRYMGRRRHPQSGAQPTSSGASSLTAGAPSAADQPLPQPPPLADALPQTQPAPSAGGSMAAPQQPGTKTYPWYIHLASWLGGIFAFFVWALAGALWNHLFKPSVLVISLVNTATIIAIILGAYLLPRRLWGGPLPKYPLKIHLTTWGLTSAILFLLGLLFYRTRYGVMDSPPAAIALLLLYALIVIGSYLLPRRLYDRKHPRGDGADISLHPQLPV